MKKNLLPILLCFILTLFLTGCSNNEKKDLSDTKEGKINLNDNIYYYENYKLTGNACGGFGFPTNAENIIEDKWFSTYENLKSVDKMELFMHDDIVFDEEKENATKKEWDKLKQPIGVKKFISGYENHTFYFEYWYINLIKDENFTEFNKNDKNYEWSQKINSEVAKFNEKAYSLISSKGGYNYQGTCGEPMFAPLLLDEEACKEYNLSCDRW